MKQRKLCVSISSYHMLPYYKQINYVICCGHNFTSFYFKIALIISVEFLAYYKSLLCCLRVFGLKMIREKRNHRMFNKNDNYFYCLVSICILCIDTCIHISTSSISTVWDFLCTTSLQPETFNSKKLPQRSALKTLCYEKNIIAKKKTAKQK